MSNRLLSFLLVGTRTVRKLAATFGGGASLAILLAFCVLATFAPQITPCDPYETYLGDSLERPSSEHFFGLDFLGRDVFSRVVFGSRLSLLVGILAMTVSLATGSMLGIISGFYGGRVDFIISRVIDFWMAFPPIIFALIIVTILGKGIPNLILAVGIASIPRLARVVRGSVLSVKEAAYVEATKALGSSSLRIMGKHILPNVAAPIFVLGTLQVGIAIINAASLSFLGLGAAPPTAEWGLMLNEAQIYMRYAPWTMIYPGVALFLVTMSTNLLGDRMREVLDPKIVRGKR